MPPLLPINETFHAWQGEGCHMGRSAFFIRTQGCPVRCPWCDAAGTWHSDYVPEAIERMAVDELVLRAQSARPEFVVITGGEPAVHDLAPLTAALQAANLPAHIETCGGYELHGRFDWITLSPKWWQLPLLENLRAAHEIKLIVENEHSIDNWLAELGDALVGQPVWLHPEWSQRENPAVLNAISQTVKQRGAPFRAGFQIHRLFNVDALDARSRPPVPLGGDPQQGM